MKSNSLMRSAIACAAVLTAMLGCSRPPQVSGEENRKLIGSLSTAVSTQRIDLLDANARKIDARHGKGEMSDEEYAAFRAVIDKAKSGDWSGARSDVLALGHAQQPTAEDVARLKKGQPGAD